MKKVLSIISILLLIFSVSFATISNAASLDTLDITTDKQIVNPGSEVVVNIEFGKELGSYTFDVAYDNNLFEYVSSEGGTSNDTGTKVRTYFFDSSGGTSPRSNMSVTFRAKEGITTSNPTDFSITAEGLANPDASVNYDDITIPITKNIVVEPQYVDYDISLTYTGEVVKQEEKDMVLTLSSTMGRYYDHVRIIAEAQTPAGATVTLEGVDEQDLTHDIIQNGWGDASGYKIGGNVNQVLNLKGMFTDSGNYTITFKLIDRDNSDTAIATKTVSIDVKEEATVIPPEENEEENIEQKPEETLPKEENQTVKEELPETLPKTGFNSYAVIVVAIIGLAILYIYINKKNINSKKSN